MDNRASARPNIDILGISNNNCGSSDHWFDIFLTISFQFIAKLYFMSFSKCKLLINEPIQLICLNFSNKLSHLRRENT